MDAQSNRATRWPAMASVGLLALAHLLTLAALAQFGMRADGLPLTQIGMAAYAVLAVASAATAIYLLAKKPLQPTTGTLALVLLPLLASYVMWLGFGGEFPPYDPFDREVVPIFVMLLALPVAITAAAYRRPALALGGFALQAALYINLYLPQYYRYEGANLLGSHPEFFILMAVTYALGLVLALVSRRGSRPGVWLASALTAGFGALMLRLIHIMLPRNGEYLGYMNAEPTIPLDAWGVLREAGHAAALLAVVAAVIICLVHLLDALNAPGEKTPNALPTN